MKKEAFLLLALLLLLGGCARAVSNPTEPEAASPTAPTVSAEAVISEPTDGNSPLPEACMLYYHNADEPICAERDSKLPAAPNAVKGVPTQVYFWHDGEYTDVDLSIARTMLKLSDGRAVLGDGWRRFVWNGERYSCLYFKVDNSYIPNITSESGGILWLELTGECWIDGGGDREMACFEGFNTVILSGNGSLRFDCLGIGCGGGELPLPAIVLDGVTLQATMIDPQPNADGTEPILALLSGSVSLEYLNCGNRNLLQTGGVLQLETLIDPGTAVFRGGTATVESWVAEEGASTVILSGGDFTTQWLPIETVAEVGAGRITACGIRYWDTVHDLGGEIVDPLDNEQA